MMNLPIAIIDSRAPVQAKERLQKDFSCVEFRTQDISYDAISGHPDVFLCKIDSNKTIYAPNTPPEITHIISSNNLHNKEGNTTVGSNIANSTAYNCVVSDKYLFHKQSFTDKTILNTCRDKKFIHVPQAYTRCSMICLPDGACITSDKGIQKALATENIPHIYCSPKNIVLPPYTHGCIGGTMGVHKNTVYIIGALQTLDKGDALKNFIHEHKCTIIELYDGALYDGGGIFFFDQKNKKSLSS
ncbi:MAG: hypothetical protein PF486_15435 [Prolixibacteraceae bacterium]|jgi:hypothetical protein|nr:hypothetical protein [Prolixibacteraceae bacterium]